MIHLTVGDLIDGRGYDLDTGGHHLYAVHDGDVVFYVGRSQCVITRLFDHVYAPTRFGSLIRDNLPISREWIATLLTPGDCGIAPEIIEGITEEEWDNTRGIIALPWTPSTGEDSEFYRDVDVGFAEIALIRFCKPCLSCTYNLEPSALPDKYGPTTADVEAQRAAVRLIHVPYKRRVMV